VYKWGTKAQGIKKRCKNALSGAQDWARNADDIAPTDGPGLAGSGAFLLAHPNVAPECPCIAVGAGDVDADAGRGLRCISRDRDLWRCGGESAKRGRSGAEEPRGEAVSAEGGEHAEREYVYF
jgi:hypothetical protein